MLRHSFNSDTMLSPARDSTKKLENLCRMCATVCVQPVNIFGQEGIVHELAVKFNSYLPVKVSEHDFLPAQLCYECINLLIQWDAAVLVAIAADKKLRALHWREQQLAHTKTNEQSPLPEVAEVSSKNTSTVRESLSCSVCNKNGMQFRELIEHLKSHEMPHFLLNDAGDQQDRTTSPGLSQQTGTLSTCHEKGSGNVENIWASSEALLEPIVNLDTPADSPQRAMRPRKRKAEEVPKSPSSSARPTGRKRGRKTKDKDDSSSSTRNVPEGSNGDAVVTSSTNGSASLKSPENSEGDDSSRSINSCLRDGNDSVVAQQRDVKKDGTTFKPKVRIISAESINQTLEERAKANQMARNAGVQGPRIIMTPPVGMPGSSISKLGNPGPIPIAPKTRLILPGKVLSEMSSTKHGAVKCLKLSDGRIVRLLHSNPQSKPAVSGSSVSTYTSTPVHQPIPQEVLKQLVGKVNQIKQGPNAAKIPVKVVASTSGTVQSLSPEKPLSPSSCSVKPLSPATSPSSPCSVKPAESESEKNVKSGSQPTKDVMINSRMITFNVQPGPKNSINRYTCSHCGKKNLLQTSLYEHAKSHSPKRNLSSTEGTESLTSKQSESEEKPRQ